MRKVQKQPAGIVEKLGHLRSGYDHIRSAREAELHATFLVRLKRRRQVELRQRNLLCPGTARPVVAANVDHSRDDGVVAGFFLVAVAENERSGWRLGGRRCNDAPTFCGGTQARFGHVVGLRGARVGGRHGGAAHVPVALPLNQQRRRGLRLFACGRGHGGRLRWRLNDDHRRRSLVGKVGIRPERRSQVEGARHAHVVAGFESC